MDRSTREKLALPQQALMLNVGLVCLAITAGCAGRTPVPAPASDTMVRIGRPCPALSSGDAPSLVLVELADTRLNPAGQDLAHAIEAPLPVRGVGRLLALVDEPVSVPWGGCQSEPCDARVGTLTVTPRLLGPNSNAVALTVQLTPHEGGTEAPQAKVVETRNQEPVLLRFDDGTPKSPVAWILTPYLLSSRDDLKQAQACTAAQAPGDGP